MLYLVLSVNERRGSNGSSIDVVKTPLIFTSDIEPYRDVYGYEIYEVEEEGFQLSQEYDEGDLIDDEGDCEDEEFQKMLAELEDFDDNLEGFDDFGLEEIELDCTDIFED